MPFPPLERADPSAFPNIIQGPGGYSITIVPGTKQKEEKNRCGLRCGSVETCRKAPGDFAAPGRGGGGGGRSIKAECYGNSEPEEHPEDLPPQQRPEEGQEEEG